MSRFPSLLSAFLLGGFVIIAPFTPAVAQEEIEVELPYASASQGDQITLEITTEDVSGKDVIGYQLILSYDGEVLDITGVDVSGTITPSTPTTNTNKANEIRINFADTEKLSGGGGLIKLEADVVGTGTSRLSVESFKFEDPLAEEVPSTTSDGAVTTNANSATVDSGGATEFQDTGVRINFSGVSGSDDVRVAKFELPPSGTDGISESNVSQWVYVITAGSGLSFDSNTEVRFDVETLRDVNNPGDVTVYTRPDPGNGSWSSLSTSHDSDADEIFVATDSFSEFAMASDVDNLPVEMAGFEAQREGRRTVRLQWQTASETDNAGFAIQRASGSAGWSRIGFVDGQGTTAKPSSYHFTDRDVPYEAASVRYRLKQVDTDGTTHVGPAVTVDLGAPERISLEAPFPNPASGSATVRYAVPRKQRLSLRVFDVLGHQVKTLVRGPRQGRFEREVNTKDLPSGIYLVQLRSEDTVKTRRLTVVH